jgi:hypothetical protein
MEHFRLYTIDEHSEVIDAVRGSSVTRFFVEFLQPGSPKPHLVLRLVIPIFTVDSVQCMGCRLSMDMDSGFDGVFNLFYPRITCDVTFREAVTFQPL